MINNEYNTVPNSGSIDLLSHDYTIAVSLTVWGLTSVFGMGTGVALSRINTTNIEWYISKWYELYDTISQIIKSD